MDIARPEFKKQRQRRRIALGILALIALGAAGFGLVRMGPALPSVERASVLIDTVKRGELLREVRGPGTLVPKEIRWIGADTSARVERIVVKPGAVVEADTVILELSNPELQDQLLAAQSAVTAAQSDLAAKRTELKSRLLDQQAALAAARADHSAAELQAEAEGPLAEKGIISAIQYKKTRIQVEQLANRLDIEQQRVAEFQRNINAQLSAEQARIDQLVNTRDLRQRQVDALNLTAGTAGVLQQVAVEEGQQVAAGTSLARVARPDVLMAQLRIPETQAKDVLLDQSVRVDTRNGVVAGRVLRIDPAVKNGSVQVDVDLIEALPPGARPDQSVDGVIEIERMADALYVGRPAFGQQDSQVRLFRIGEDGIATRGPVRLGKASVNQIQILDGLKVGDRVILSDTNAFDQHDRIRLK